MPESSNKPCVAPSSPSLPCSTGNTTSKRILSYCPCSRTSNPWTLLSGDSAAGRQLPFSQFVSGPSQSFQAPLFVIPIQNGSYFSVSRCFATSCADLTEMGCSSARPPNIIPTFNLSMLLSPFKFQAIDAVGHDSSLGSVVLPARMRFSICRRYATGGRIESMRVLIVEESMRVLIVEDEPYLAEAIRDGLRLAAIAADIAGDGDTALELLSINAYDSAVLDRDIPGPSGDEIAKCIVASGSGMPILMLTAADRLDDKASGFEIGADDYLTKPFALQELVLRLRALDRRRAYNRPPVREIAGLRLDPFRREVYRDGRYVALTRKQFAVLEVLVTAEGGVVSAEELLERAWDENADPFTNAARITVSALRKRLGEPWIIATVAGVGYRIDTRPDTGPEGGDRG